MSGEQYRVDDASAGPPGRERARPVASRTTWAEEQAAALCGFPLTAETVFLRVKYHKGGEKEVCDLLLAVRDACIVLSLKHQDDPRRRTGDALGRWCAKAATAAARQLDGAVKTIESRPFWCDHARRGRVDFAAGDLRVKHAIACVETFSQVVLPQASPDNAHGAPVTYLSSNDLLNLIQQLRSLPDLLDYLDARLTLPSDLSRTIGREKDLYQFYLLNDETFDGCRSLDDLEATLARHAGKLERRIAEKQEQDFYATLIEYVSDALAKRAPDYAAGLDPTTLARFDADGARQNYLLIQENLCDLRLGERRALGEAFYWLRQRIAEESLDLLHQSFWSDLKPHFLYVLACAKGLDRVEILRRAETLLIAGLAYRGKREGMVIVDRDGKGFEVIQAAMRKASAEALAAGEVLFGRLKITDTAIRLLPDDGRA